MTTAVAPVLLLALLVPLSGTAQSRSTSVRIAVRVAEGDTGSVAELTDDVESILRRKKPGATVVVAADSEAPEVVLWLTRRFMPPRRSGQGDLGSPVTCAVEGFVVEARHHTDGRWPAAPVSGSGALWKDAAVDLVDAAEAVVQARLHTLLRERPDWPDVGFGFEDLTDVRKREYGARDGGVVVTLVEPEGVAQRAGLQVGDALLRTDGKRLKRAADLAQALYTCPPGAKLTLEIVRQGTRQTVALPLP